MARTGGSFPPQSPGWFWVAPKRLKPGKLLKFTNDPLIGLRAALLDASNRLQRFMTAFSELLASPAQPINDIGRWAL